jgi:hypothetical protein
VNQTVRRHERGQLPKVLDASTNPSEPYEFIYESSVVLWNPVANPAEGSLIRLPFPFVELYPPLLPDRRRRVAETVVE